MGTNSPFNILLKHPVSFALVPGSAGDHSSNYPNLGFLGLRMWHQAGARAMHRNLRSQGPTRGDEGRAKIQENRKRQAEEKRQAKIAVLSSVTIGERGPTGD